MSLLMGKYFNHKYQFKLSLILWKSVWPNKFRLIKKKERERASFTVLDTGKHASVHKQNIHTYRQNLWKNTIQAFSECLITHRKRVQIPFGCHSKLLRRASTSKSSFISHYVPLASMLNVSKTALSTRHVILLHCLDIKLSSLYWAHPVWHSSAWKWPLSFQLTILSSVKFFCYPSFLLVVEPLEWFNSF